MASFLQMPLGVLKRSAAFGGFLLSMAFGAVIGGCREFEKYAKGFYVEGPYFPKRHIMYDGVIIVCNGVCPTDWAAMP